MDIKDPTVTFTKSRRVIADILNKLRIPATLSRVLCDPGLVLASKHFSTCGGGTGALARVLASITFEDMSIYCPQCSGAPLFGGVKGGGEGEHYGTINLR